MRRCTVFALPSRYEGLGCVYLEAMSVGKPVIGCRGQGIAEIIQHGFQRFLVGPDNERELTLAMAMLLRDEPRRRNLGRRCSRHDPGKADSGATGGSAGYESTGSRAHEPPSSDSDGDHLALSYPAIQCSGARSRRWICT